MANVPIADRSPWSFRSWIWDADTHLKSSEELKLLLKLDWAILSVGCLGFFMKFLDQTNMANAYVSGMKEDLHMMENEYTYAMTLWTAAYALMQVPSTLIVQYVRPRVWLAAMEVGWGIWTLAQALTQSTSQLYAFRFLIGLFEASFSPVMVYLIGAWYTKPELAKRLTLFQVAAPLGASFSGYLQATIYDNIAGWRWLYIICGCMTLPVGVVTWFLLPDLPHSTKAWFLTEEERRLAISRMASQGIAEPTKLSMSTLKRIFTRWRWYGFVLAFVLYGSSCLPGAFFGIWLKSAGFSVYDANVIPTGTLLISGVISIVWGYLADSTGNRFLYVVIPLLLGLVPNGILAIWPPGIAIKEAAFLLIGIQLMPGVFFSWALEACRDDNEERAIVTSSMNCLSFAVTAWLPIIIFPQTMAPDFRYGFPASWGLAMSAIIAVVGVQLMIMREERLKIRNLEEIEIQSELAEVK